MISLFGINFFLPPFFSVFGTLGAIIVNGSVLLATFAYLVYATRFFTEPVFVDRAERSRAGLIVLCFLVYALQVTAGNLLLSKDLIFRDIFELHKPFLHAVSFVLPFVVVRRVEDFRRVFTLLLWIGVICLGMAAFQLSHVSDALAGLYLKHKNVVAFRAAMPFVNPYDFGWFMVAMVALSIAAYVGLGRVKYVLLLPLFCVGVVLTQSRGAFISLVFLFCVTSCVYAALWMWAVRQRWSQELQLHRYTILIAIGVFLLAIIVIQYQEQLAYLFNGLRRLWYGQSFRSLSARAAQMDFTVELMSSSVWRGLFGNGVGKTVLPHLESIYTFFLFRYGLVGLLMVFCVPVCAAIYYGVQVMCARLPRSLIYVRILSTLVVLWFATLFVAGLTNNFTEQIRLSFFTYFLIGLQLRAYSVVRAQLNAKGEI